METEPDFAPVSRGLAEAVAGTGITVNSVLPGPTRSRGLGDFVLALAREAGKSLAEFEADFLLPELVRFADELAGPQRRGAQRGGLMDSIG